MQSIFNLRKSFTDIYCLSGEKVVDHTFSEFSKLTRQDLQ